MISVDLTDDVLADAESTLYMVKGDERVLLYFGPSSGVFHEGLEKQVQDKFEAGYDLEMTIKVKSPNAAS